MKTWIKLNHRGALSEVDPVRLFREGETLRQVLKGLQEDTYDLSGRCLPVLKEVLEESLNLPLESAPLPITRMEDAGVVFPEGFIDAYCAFFMTAQGYRYDQDKVERNDRGEEGVWVEFEDTD